MGQDLGGKTVLITGASRGIGEAAARAFAAEGAQVALLARSAEALGALAGELGPEALAVPCDVSRYWEMRAAVDAARQHFGSVDVVVNNAGVIGHPGPMAEVDPEDWAQTVDINLMGVFHGMRAALPAMLEAGGGTIITVSSGAAHAPVEGWSAYCAAKAGALMLTRSLHHEYAERGIRAMSLSPGTVATQMQKDISASGVGPVAKLDWSAHIPPDWPARALVWLCSPDADGYRGEEVRLRDAEIREKVGLTAPGG